MPWEVPTLMSLREQFVRRAVVEGANVSSLCREFGISRKTGYKWLGRSGEAKPDFSDRSRRPRRSPGRVGAEVEGPILAIREAHPAWGARKIRARMDAQGIMPVPAASTVHAVLDRHGLVGPARKRAEKADHRFRAEEANDLWQGDFMGFLHLVTGGLCHPLSVVDDRSRFAVGLFACPNQTFETVREAFTTIFRLHGLPHRMLMDNGAPWGDSASSPYTILTTWLMRLGVQVIHGRPAHPQTQGKVERFHRTLKEELLRAALFTSLDQCQRRFDLWRDMYNNERPHEALDQQPPSSCYASSPRLFPETLPSIIYQPDDIVRKVDERGQIYFAGSRFRISKAFRHQPVALRPGPHDGVYAVFFCQYPVHTIDLRDPLD